MNLFRKRPPRTLFEVLVARAGVVKGARVATFVIAMSVAMEMEERHTGERGGEWAMERFAEATGYSRAKAYRDQALYREVVTEFPDVLDLIERMRELRVVQRQRSIESVDVTAVLVA